MVAGASAALAFQIQESYISDGVMTLESSEVMKTLWVLGIVAGSVLVTACSRGPAPAKPGTSAFFWQVAQQSYHAGDLLKTDGVLLDLSRRQNGYASRARIVQLVVSAGITQGLWELSDAYQAGSEVTPARLRTEAFNLRSQAAGTALEFTQAVHDLASDQEPTICFEFPFPPGSVARPIELSKVSAGEWLSDWEREGLERAILQRGVILAVTYAVGAANDSAMAATEFQSGNAQIPRAVFLTGMARLLYQQANVFGAKGLDRADRYLVMAREALETVQSLPPTPETAQLAAKIEATIKNVSGI